MPEAKIPTLERKLPGGIWMPLSVAFVYLAIVPVNWLMCKLGSGPKLLCSIMNQQLGKEGPARAFRDYTPAGSDVFVCTYSKSGTNWMLQIAHQIAFHGKGEYEHIHDVVSWPDMDPTRSPMFSISLQSELVAQLSPEHLRVIKTHLSTRYVPYSDNARYIVVVRDPKEVFVSSYYFVKSSFGPMMASASQWFELFLGEGFPMNFGSTWAEHLAGYWALRDKPNVLILFYSAMKRDLPGTIQRVADFLEVSLSAEEFSTVLHKSSFEYMKGIDDKFLPLPRGSLPWSDTGMMRTGKTGNTSELLGAEQQKQIDVHFQAELLRLGSDFPYAEHFQQ